MRVCYVKAMKLLFLILLAPFIFSPSVFAQVYANPSYQILGTVRAGQSRMTTVTFMNQSMRPIQWVSANCSGSYSAFSCSSSCFSMGAYGSCSVYVTFHPTANDGMIQNVSITLSGMGAFATATISGTDAYAPSPEVQDSAVEEANNVQVEIEPAQP
jgi:hypothetical protein